MKAAAVWLSCLCSLQASDKIFFQKGVNFTAEGRTGYSPASVVGMLDQLRADGVNAIALVPYGFSNKTEPVIRFGGGSGRAESIEVVSALAAERLLQARL